MRKFFFLLIAFSTCYIANAQEAVIAKSPEIITGKLIKVTKALRDFTIADKSIPDVIVRDEDGIIGKDEEFEEGSDPILYPAKIFSEDPALQKIYPSKPHKQSAIDRAIVTNFLGMPYQPLNPPDPTLCVGPNHVIQMINGASGALFKVYNKSGGQVVAQTYLDAITGKGGLGDPIAQYDQLADRFMLTEFANKPETGTEGLIVAITKTSDPAGQWYVYFFSTGNTFPDYPKFSVWPDAYYATTNDFANASSYSGSSVYAFDRAKMLVGNGTATVQKFTLGTTNKYFSMCPVGLEGTSLPPAGTGGLVAYMADDAWTSTTSDVDSIGILEFKVDFVTPSNTRVLTKASLATLPFKSDICTTTRGQCITQPGSSIKVEALHQKVMDQPIYRNFAGYEGIVMSHVADKGSNISGIRWYELHKTTGNWSIYQQSTYSPDNTHRWLPGICYDTYGNIGLAYNVASSATGVFAGARYTGRQQCDPLNTMTYSEAVIIAGAAANGSTRYGDYNQLVCDPDGVTFWFTCEYNQTSQWSTRIASFTLDPCNVTCGDPTGLISSAITNTSATVSWVAVPNAVSYDVDYKLTTTSTWTNAATALNATTKNISGLTQGTTYDWRVRANCSGGSGNYISAQFTTTLPCNAPAGLTTSSITSNSANISWNSATGANSYDVEYKATNSSTWISLVSGTISTSASLSSLAASTSYDWRVRSNCSSGSSSFTSTTFSTLAPPLCNAPAGLTTSSITNNSANISWGSATGANSYDVEYKATSSSTWISIASGTTSTTASLSGLAASTSYDWRVRSNCSAGSSSFTSTTFSTLAPPVCNAPAGLTTSSITTSSASISWGSAAGANSYDVEYKATSSSTWISVVSGTTSTSASLSGLAAATSYDWRVRSNCSLGSSSFSSTQFTTATAGGCTDPTGLTASSITATSADVSWNPVGGAIDYNVFYKANSASGWSLGARNIPGTVFTLTGLSPSTAYTWRVKANCSSGGSLFVLAGFTTTAAGTCNPPSGLVSSSITSTGAAVSWSSVSGANNYDVDYKLTSSSTWINAATATSSTSINLSGLAATTSYDWRVRANCSSGSSAYTSAQFTTLASGGCPDQLEPNDSYATAADVNTGIDILAQISHSGDEDFYRFNNTPSQSKMKATLTNLPADYDLQLFTKTGLVTRTSQNPGTVDESVILNTTNSGSYVVRVYSASGAFSSSQCYTLNIQIGSANFTAFDPTAPAIDKGTTTLRGGLKVYPVPASSSLTVSFDAYKRGTADLIITNRLGQQMMRKTVRVDDGINTTNLDVSKITPGMYFLKVINGKEVQMKKVMIGR